MERVRLYTTSACPYCRAAKALLDELGVAYEEILLDGRDELRAELGRRLDGWRTVPMIFIGERFVGGFAELRRLHLAGELERLLHPGN